MPVSHLHAVVMYDATSASVWATRASALLNRGYFELPQQHPPAADRRATGIAWANAVEVMRTGRTVSRPNVVGCPRRPRHRSRGRSSTAARNRTRRRMEKAWIEAALGADDRQLHDPVSHHNKVGRPATPPCRCARLRYSAVSPAAVCCSGASVSSNEAGIAGPARRPIRSPADACWSMATPGRAGVSADDVISLASRFRLTPSGAVRFPGRAPSSGGSPASRSARSPRPQALTIQTHHVHRESARWPPSWNRSAGLLTSRWVPRPCTARCAKTAPRRGGTTRRESDAPLVASPAPEVSLLPDDADAPGVSVRDTARPTNGVPRAPSRVPLRGRLIHRRPPRG